MFIMYFYDFSYQNSSVLLLILEILYLRGAYFCQVLQVFGVFIGYFCHPPGKRPEYSPLCQRLYTLTFAHRVSSGSISCISRQHQLNYRPSFLSRYLERLLVGFQQVHSFRLVQSKLVRCVVNFSHILNSILSSL